MIINVYLSLSTGAVARPHEQGLTLFFIQFHLERQSAFTNGLPQKEVNGRAGIEFLGVKKRVRVVLSTRRVMRVIEGLLEVRVAVCLVFFGFSSVTS